MARYGMDYGRDFDRMGRGGRFGGGGYQQPIGGMRSDAGGGHWSDFPGEEGWFGEGYAGYPGGGYPGGGYDFGYRGGGRGYGGMGRSGYGMDYGGDFAAGGYGGGMGGGMGGGYTGRDMGYGGGMTGGGYGGNTWDMNQRGWRPSRERSQMRAADLMTENPEAVTPDATLADVARKMRELDVGIIPVVDSAESRRLRGVITDRDIAIRAVAEGKDGKARVSDCMTPDVETVNKNDSINQVLNVMRREQVRRVPVTDREGRLVGIIAQADLAVEYAEGDGERELMVEETIERISEPARPGRGRAAIQARGRGEGSETGARQGRGGATGQQTGGQGRGMQGDAGTERSR